MDPQGRYAAVVEALLSHPDVTPPSVADRAKKGFGSAALKIDGKIFAMLVRDRLVVKLPRARVDALVDSGDGERLDPGHGRIMKEWLSLDPASDEDWLPLAREALEFVAPSR